MQNKKKFKLFVIILLVIFSQCLLLNPIIGQGLTNEDYVGLFKVRLYENIMFSDPVNIWNQIGLHDAAHDFYIGLLDLIFGENYTIYLYVSIAIKIIATLLLYPLILLISKNKLLAFLGTIIYGLSYPSTGALSLYVVGNEYLGVALMNLFLITYYFCIKTPKKWLLILSSILVTLSYISSPIRVFPVFCIIIFTEIFIFFKSKRSQFIQSFFRTAVIFLPALLITISGMDNSGSGAYSLAGMPDFLKQIADGHWYHLLNPLWGLGNLLLPAPYFYLLGQINISSLMTYLISLPQILIIFITHLLSFFLSKKPMRFFLIFMSINFLLEILIFLLLTHHFSIHPSLIVKYSPSVFLFGQYTNIIACFIISLSLTCAIEWYLTNKQNQLLLFTFISPFFSLLFIISQWIFTRDYFMYQQGIHRYLVIPEIGISIFSASLVTNIYSKRKKGVLWYTSLIVIFFLFFLINKEEIARGFYIKRNAGADLQAQESMKTQVLSYIPKSKIGNDLLFFIRLSAGTNNSTAWEEAFDWRNITYWMHIKRSYLTEKPIDGCIGMIWDESELQKMARMHEEQRGFLYRDGGNKEIRCFHNSIGYSLDGKFIKLDNLYAFAIDRGNVENITKEIVDKLSFEVNDPNQ